MNYEKLCEKLKESKFIGLSNSEAFNLLQNETIKTRVLVSVVDIKRWALENNIYADIVLGQKDSDIAKAKLCISIIGWLDDVGGRVQTVDFSVPIVSHILTQLMSFGYATQQQIDSLEALGWKDTPWSDLNDCEGLLEHNIIIAREYIGDFE